MSGAIMNKIWGAFGMDANEEEEEEFVKKLAIKKRKR